MITFDNVSVTYSGAPSAAVEGFSLSAQNAGFSKKDARTATASWLESVHVEPELFERYPSALSGGQAPPVRTSLSTSLAVLSA